MNKKIFAILIIIFIILTWFGVRFWRQLQTAKMEREKQAEEADVKFLVESFGRALKKVSLLSPTAAQDIEENYKDFLDPILLNQWKADPTKAIGRLTSSPWPERIEILSIKQFGAGAYDVSGNIIEITSVEQIEGGIAAKRPIELGVVKFDNRWLIVSVNLGEYLENDIAAQLRDCLPKSDMASREKCQQLLNNINNFEECVMAGFPIMKSNPPQCQTIDGRIFVQETNSTWEQAVLALNNCEVEKAFQTHNKIITLTLKNGNKLIAREPQIDEIIKVIEETEAKCGNVPMGTE